MNTEVRLPLISPYTHSSCIPVWVLQLICWLLNKTHEHELYVVIQNWLLVQHERLIHIHVTCVHVSFFSN